MRQESSHMVEAIRNKQQGMSRRVGIQFRGKRGFDLFLSIQGFLLMDPGIQVFLLTEMP